ncbi:MAG: M3 family oligoendopeptidase [Cellulosilyticaceae bacterium]
MGLQWNLDALYESFESGAYTKDLRKLEDVLRALEQWVDEITQDHTQIVEKLESFIKRQETLTLLSDRLSGFASLRQSVDAQDEMANRMLDQLDQRMSVLAKTGAKLTKWICGIENLDELVQKHPGLAPYHFYLKEIVAKESHTLGEDEERMMARMRSTGSTSWLNYKNLLISKHRVTVKLGDKLENLPLTQVLNLAYDADAKVRKAAYEAEVASYEEIAQGVAAALNGIKGEVLTTCELRGYQSPLEMTLSHARMDRETLDAMLVAIKESLPVFRSYLRRKAELLGYQNGLPFYELYAPVGAGDQLYDYEAGKAFVIKHFGSFSKKLADFAYTAFDGDWIDVLPREGKRGGAFCRNLRSIGQSRILLNYGDSLSDVITLAHELGHGFHGVCLTGQSPLNTRYPMPLAETASTFCETIVKKAALQTATGAEALGILETEICDCTQVIVDIYSRFLFETELFERRSEGPLSVNELKEMMLRAQKEAYGDGLDSEYLHPYMWTWKPHYYYVGSNFYNFPYAFGQLFAKGLYSKYQEMGDDFVQEYETLLGDTGRLCVRDVASQVGIDVSDVAFWRASLKMIEADITAFMEMSQA